MVAAVEEALVALAAASGLADASATKTPSATKTQSSVARGRRRALTLTETSGLVARGASTNSRQGGLRRQSPTRLLHQREEARRGGVVVRRLRLRCEEATWGGAAACHLHCGETIALGGSHQHRMNHAAQ